MAPAPPAQPLVLVRGVCLVNDLLLDTDPRDRRRAGCHCKVYTIQLRVGKTYQIDMTSDQLDSYLRLEDASGRELAHDDDSGGHLNARIRFRCPQNGTYRVIATTFGPATGRFDLRIQEQ
jgi:hypothetical protein